MTDKKIVLITGGNTGIGYQTVKAFLHSGQAYLVLMGSRSLEKAHAAIEQLKTEVPQTSSSIEAVQIDVSSDESIQKAFETDQEEKAGKLTMREAWNKTFDVNVPGSYMVTYVFMPLLLKSADPRLLFITSGLSSLTRTRDQFYPPQSPHPAGWPKQFSAAGDHTSYRSVKAALNMMMINLRFQLSADGVKTWSIAPGFLATNLGGVGKDLLQKFGAGDPSIGGNFIRDVVEGKRDADEGRVVCNDGSVQPW
ncbi:hypothetical protein SLS62_008977 [Diatrype stigma]|uniref:Short chain dehydrogenase n=1 Tax=Diatrype stigma TaxID=117547 RepID=A0AAN9YKP0_9PEZI